jgi:WD40 repeat protein
MTSDVALLPVDVDSRERIPGSPLVPGGVAWSEDGRLAVVSDSSVLVATFRSRELEMFQPEGPAVSKDFVFLPERITGEHLPVAIPPGIESLDVGLPRASATYFLLNDGDRHQHNPKELSLSKNTGLAFVAAVWGPRGSAPSSSCALLTLTASARVSLHFPPSFHMSWKEVAVFSENLFKYLEGESFRLGPSHDARLNQLPAGVATTAPRRDKAGKKKKRKLQDPAQRRLAMDAVADYTHRCAMMSTLTMAWSPFMVTADKKSTTSLIALSGRKVGTVWSYAYPSFVGGQQLEPFLSSTPVAWIDTAKYGWVSTSTWQQMHRHGTAYTVQKSLGLALGTSEGNVLIATVPVRATALNGSPQELAVDRVIVAPHAQPVFGLCMGSRWTYSNSPTNALVVASGSTISVWDLKKKKQARPNAKWKAHDGNVTGIDLNYFGDTVFSAGVDGTIKAWEKTSGNELFSSDVAPATAENSDGAPSAASAGSKYPVFGLALSPSSAQLACLFIIPPASRPNRKSQADVSYSRVSSALEYVPSPWVKSPDQFVDVVCRILNESQSVSSFMDVVWFCYNDNAAVLALNGSTDVLLPSLLSKIKSVSSEASGNEVLARQPLYLHLCEELDKRYFDSCQPASAARNEAVPPVPLFLQASLLLRNAITPTDRHVAAQTATLAKIRRLLGVYWAERCLVALMATAKKADKSLRDCLGESPSEQSSALAMADFLSVQEALTSRSEALVTHIYDQLDSPEHVAEWIAYVKARVSVNTAETHATEEPATPAAVRVPPAREACFICEKSVPFGELEVACESGHTLERCFLSFRCISAMEVWKCMGCGASASEIDLSSGTAPFYLLDSGEDDENDAVAASAASRTKIICRLCGSYCSFSKY